MHGQTNFVRMLWKFSSVYNPDLQMADHARPVKYEMRPPADTTCAKPSTDDLYVHTPVTVRGESPIAAVPV